MAMLDRSLCGLAQKYFRNLTKKLKAGCALPVSASAMPQLLAEPANQRMPFDGWVVVFIDGAFMALLLVIAGRLEGG